MNANKQNISDVIILTSTIYYVMTVLGCILLAAVVIFIVRRLSAEKKTEDTKAESRSKGLSAANVIIHVLCGVIVLFIIGTLLYPFISINF